MSGIAFEKGEPVVVNDYASYPNADPARVAHGIKSAISLLLRADGRVVGSLNVNSKESGHFTPDRVRFLTAISDGLGVLMENANLAEQARNREEQYRMLFENSSDAVYIESHGRVLDMNQAALDMFGMSLEEALAYPANDFFVDPDAQIRLGQALDATGSTKDFEAKLFKKDGSEIDCLFTATMQLSREDPRSTTQGIIRDVTEQKLAESALRESEEEALRLAHENAVMAEIGRIISASLNIDDVYDSFAEEVRKLVPFDRIDVNLANLNEGVVTHAYWTGLEMPGRHRGDVSGLRGTALEELCRTGSGILFHPEDGEQVTKRFPGLLPAFNSGLRSFVGSPLVSGNRVIGGLFLASTQPNAYTERDLELTQRVGSEIAGAIANANLYAERQRADERVRESLQEKEGLLEEIQVLYGQERRKADQLQVISEVSRDVASILDLDLLLERTTELIQSTFGYLQVGVGIIEGDRLEIRAMTGSDGFGGPSADAPQSVRIGEEGITGWVAATGVSMLVPDVSKEPRYHYLPGAIEARSELAVPIKAKGEVIGVVDVASDELERFDESDRVVLQLLADHIGVAIDNARLMGDARELAVLEERNRMAREIHDTMAQGFTGIVLQLEAAEQAFEEAPAELPDHLDRAKTLARECLQEARRSVWDLLPRALEEHTLAEALREEVRKFASEGPTRADLRVSGTLREISSYAQTALLRICQESLTNVRKHARATEVELHLEFDSEFIRLSISDNGVGILSGKGAEETGEGGFGIKGMEQRANLLRGVLKISKGINKGTRVEVTIPVD